MAILTSLLAPVLRLAIHNLHVVDQASGCAVGQATSTSEALHLRLVELRRRHGAGAVNLPLPTAGGLQFWGDRCWAAGWRIQEHVLTGHCRLIAPNHVRRAWGSFAACQVRALLWTFALFEDLSAVT